MEINTNKLFFLRGLGLGIIVTTILCSIFPSKMSNEEIIKKAKELGMVEASDNNEDKYESLISGGKDKGEGQSYIGEIDDEVVPLGDEVNDEVKVEATLEPTPEPTPEPTIEPTPEPTIAPTLEPEKAKTVTIVVESGMSSESVARLLEKKGLVDDAKAFNKYLVESGYASKINVGEVEIPVGADYKTVAKALD